MDSSPVTIGPPTQERNSDEPRRVLPVISSSPIHATSPATQDQGNGQRNSEQRRRQQMFIIPSPSHASATTPERRSFRLRPKTGRTTIKGKKHSRQQQKNATNHEQEGGTIRFSDDGKTLAAHLLHAVYLCSCIALYYALFFYTHSSSSWYIPIGKTA